MSCVTAASLTHMPPETGMGHIQVIFGPMFSGKTTELMRRIKRYQIALRGCAMVKYHADQRYSQTGVASHDKQTFPAISAHALMPLVDDLSESKYSVIGIDEGQFFPDLIEFCDHMASIGKTVIVAALDGTFQRQPFGNVLQLVPMAESVVKLSAVCMMCCGEAAFSKRIGSETAIEVIGGADKYVAVCRACYDNKCESP